MSDMKHSSKDSVFTYLFRQPAYTRQLYLSLHPEDTDVTEAECRVITLENILTVGQYNDLGIQVRDRLIILVEAQSTFSVNIALRLLLYLAETYTVHIKEHKLNLYSSTPVKVPRPELYVIYTGNRKEVPDTLYLSDLFFDGTGDVEVTVHVLRGGENGDILDQYVQFCKILDTQRKLYGWTLKTIQETLRICIAQNILAPFLQSREKEVADIMSILFDEKTIMELHDHDVAQKARQQGKQEGKEEGKKETVLRIANLSMALTEAGRIDELPKALADTALYEKLLTEFNL